MAYQEIDSTLEPESRRSSSRVGQPTAETLNRFGEVMAEERDHHSLQK